MDILGVFVGGLLFRHPPLYARFQVVPDAHTPRRQSPTRSLVETPPIGPLEV